MPVLALAAAVLLGCSVTPLEPSPTSPVTSDRLGQVRRSLDELNVAILAADRAGFDRLISLRDPTFGSRARLLYTNLTSLRLTGLDFLVEPAERPLPPDRQRVLGQDAWVHRVAVATRSPSEDGVVQHQVWLTFVIDGGRTKLAGTIDEPAGETEPRPLWWLGPVTTAVDREAAVVAGSGQSAAQWAELAARSARTVRSILPAGLAEDWDGWISLEVPATERDFASVLGEPFERYAGIAAVVRPAGTTADAPLRIVVNPRAREITSPESVAELLRHETVHVATRSSDSPAPLWAEEGLAEWAALGRAPVDGQPATRELLADVERRGPPVAPPADEAFAAGGPELSRAYAEAWLMCRYVAERYSAARLGRLYAELDQNRSLDDASRAVLGIDADQLLAGWRRYLVRLARAA